MMTGYPVVNLSLFIKLYTAEDGVPDMTVFTRLFSMSLCPVKFWVKFPKKGFPMNESTGCTNCVLLLSKTAKYCD